MEKKRIDAGPEKFGLAVKFPDNKATQHYSFDDRDDIIQIGDFIIQKNKDEKGKDAWSLEFDSKKSKMKEVAEKLANKKEISDDGSVKIALKKVTILGTGNIEFELESTEGRKNFSNESKFTITPNSVKISKDEIHVTKGLEVMDVTLPRNFPQLFLSGSQTSKISSALPREFLTSICSAMDWFNLGRNEAVKIQVEELTNTNNTPVRFLKCGDNVFAVSRSKMRRIEQIHRIKQQDGSFKTVFKFQGDEKQRSCDFKDDPSSFFNDKLGLVYRDAVGTRYEDDLTKNELKGSDESYSSFKTATEPNDDTNKEDDDTNEKDDDTFDDDIHEDNKNVIFTPRAKNFKPTTPKSLKDRLYKSIKTATTPEPTPEPSPKPTPEPATKIEQKDGHWVIDGTKTASFCTGVSYEFPGIDPDTKQWLILGELSGVLAQNSDGEEAVGPQIDDFNVVSIGKYIVKDYYNKRSSILDGKISQIPQPSKDGNWIINSEDTRLNAYKTKLKIVNDEWRIADDTAEGKEISALTNKSSLGKNAPKITIDPVTKHWLVNDVDTGEVAEVKEKETEPEPTPEPTPEPATKIEQKDDHWVINGKDTVFSYKGKKANDGTKPKVVDGKYEGTEILASSIQPETTEIDGKKVWKIDLDIFPDDEYLLEGIDGKDSTVEINEKGNWVINGTDTGKKAESTPLNIFEGIWHFGEKQTDGSMVWKSFEGPDKQPLYAVGGKAQNGANVIIQEDGTFAIQNSNGKILETGISAVAKIEEEEEEEEKDVLEEASAATQFELDGNNIIIKNGDFAEDKTVDCRGEKGKSTEIPGIDTMRHWEGTEYLAINSDGEMASKIERVDEDTIKIGDTEYKGFAGKEGNPLTEENLPTRSEDGYWVFRGEKSNLRVEEAHLTIDDDGLWKHLTKDADGKEVLESIHSFDDEKKEIKASARGENGEDGKSLKIDDKSKNWLVAGEDTSKPAVAQEKEKNKEEEKEEKKEEPNEKYKFSSAPLFYIGGLILGVLGILTGLGWLLALAALLFSTPKLTEGIVNDRKANFHKSSQTKKILKSRNKKLVPSFKKVKHASKEFGKNTDECKGWNTAFNKVQGKNATLSKEARKQIQGLDLKTPLDALKKRQEKIDELKNYLGSLQKDPTNGSIEGLETSLEQTFSTLDDLSASNTNMINNFEILAEAQTRSKYPDMPSQLLAAALDPFYETTPTTEFDPEKLKDNIQDKIKDVCGTHLKDQKDELQGDVQKGFNEIYKLLDSHDASSKRMDVDFNRSI